MIDMTKQYQIRDSKLVRLLCVDGPSKSDAKKPRLLAWANLLKLSN